MTAGFVHLVYGASESAKTWLAYIAVTQEVQRGNTVLVVDYEMGGGQVADRLRTLGLSDEQMDAGVVYVSPEASLSDRDRAGLVDHIGDRPLTLAVFDTLGEATTMDGLSGNDDADMVAWFRATTRWVVTQWPTCAVAVIDHLPKDRADSPFPIGSQRKRAYPLVLLSVRSVKPFSRNAEGYSVVTVHKSRDGRLPRGVIARINGGPGGVNLAPDSGDGDKEDQLRDSITAVLTAHPGATTREIVKEAKGSSSDLTDALREMTAEQLVIMTKVGRAHQYRLAENVVEIDL